jgi:hypothetical protein
LFFVSRATGHEPAANLAWRIGTLFATANDVPGVSGVTCSHAGKGMVRNAGEASADRI